MKVAIKIMIMHDKNNNDKTNHKTNSDNDNKF